MSITLNKSLNPSSNLLINYISARSAPQILSIKDECTFPFSNFLIIGLCNSSANSLFEIFSFLIALPEADLSRVAKVSDRESKADFLSKIYKPLKQDPFDIHHILGF